MGAKFEWWTDGENNLKVFSGQVAPSGYNKGFTLKKKTLERKQKEKTIKINELNHLKEEKKGKSRQEIRIINEEYKSAKELSKFKKRMNSFLEEENKRILKALQSGITSEKEITALCKDIITPGFDKRLKIKILAWQLFNMPQYKKTITSELEEIDW